MVQKEIMMYLVEICTRGWCQPAQLTLYLFNVGNHVLDFFRGRPLGTLDTEYSVNNSLSPGWIDTNGIWI